ncbi:hypothetical protein [Effusibacillus lacus]|uniref:Uncharacterized protein n=1 Tax=Effusibacillus lacus TaxID=1348429 RepID=A0A292YM87_9BACL|nr:hypothetical protein [Effusibacillus lacus]TCS71256.1 hypothetical protein EDD64_12756 [Effusibacillus lacus]GAX89883.1 hypothetical protein EFBL_1508 [Effusibacillus lacus]
MANQPNWNEVELPEGSELLRKELYDYNSSKGQYQIELYETPDGRFYAIGTNKDPDAKMIVYGSNVVYDKRMALQTVMEKIEREGAWCD